jgi:hypothetical protein
MARRESEHPLSKRNSGFQLPELRTPKNTGNLNATKKDEDRSTSVELQGSRDFPMSTRPRGSKFRAGDEVALAEGTRQGDPWYFFRLRENANWADNTERNGSIRSHRVAWLAHSTGGIRVPRTEAGYRILRVSALPSIEVGSDRANKTDRELEPEYK